MGTIKQTEDNKLVVKMTVDEALHQIAPVKSPLGTNQVFWVDHIAGMLMRAVMWKVWKTPAFAHLRKYYKFVNVTGEGEITLEFSEPVEENSEQ